MNSPSASPIKLHAQRGGVSPFMFGLLIGMSIFSLLSMQWAKRELEETQKRRNQQAMEQAEDVTKALEFSAMTETKDTYSADFDLNRAKRYTNSIGDKTRGGQDVLVVSRDEDPGTFGKTGQRIAVTSSDDTLLRSKVYRTGNADDIARLADGESPVAVLDTSDVRDRQVRTSVTAMEGIAEQVYAFYAAHMRFPKPDEFDQLQQKFPYRDAWGERFSYTWTNDNDALLEFTTPWNYTHPMKLSLDDEVSGQKE